MMHLFSYEEGSLLIKLFIAHFIADFVLQTDKSIADKRAYILKSKYFWLHIFFVLLATCIALLGYAHILGCLLGIVITHAIIDALKLYAEKSTKINFAGKSMWLFLIDQLLHYAIIIIAWAAIITKGEEVIMILKASLNSYKGLIIALGYLLVIYPVSYLIKFLTADWANEVNIQNDSLENAGKWIGVLERLIVLTLVLIEQYEAIGFLIAAKSLLRLTDKLDMANNNNAQNIPATQQTVTARKLTEYVLIGTFLSFGFAMAIGFAIKWLLNM